MSGECSGVDGSDSARMKASAATNATSESFVQRVYSYSSYAQKEWR